MFISCRRPHSTRCHSFASFWRMFPFFVMADDLKLQKGSSKSLFAKRLQKRLQALECPLIEGADENHVCELVLTPGEPRIRILQWLLSRLHSSAYNVLSPTNSTSDGKFRAMLKVTSAMGICHPADLQLIEGRTSLAKQISFIDKLVDAVSVSCEFQSPASRQFIYQGRVTTADQFAGHCSMLDAIVQKQPVCEIFPADVAVLPADVKQCLAMTSLSVNADRDERGDVELKDLVQRLAILQADMSRQAELFHLLNSEYTGRESDRSGRDLLIRKFKLIMSELQQMMTNCKYCYENNIEAWCSRETPSLSSLGERILATQRLLNAFSTVLGAVKVTKTAHERLEALGSASSKSCEGERKELNQLDVTLNQLEQTLNTVSLRT